MENLDKGSVSSSDTDPSDLPLSTHQSQWICARLDLCDKMSEPHGIYSEATAV